MKRNLWLILMLVAMLALWGCSDDDDDDNGTEPPVPTVFETIVQELDDQINGGSQLITADVLQPALDDWEVVDVRRQQDYDAGHIPGAIYSSLGDVVTTVQAQDWESSQPIVVVCYTGQSARFAQLALQTYGYTEVRSLKFGMSAWHTSFVESPSGVGYWRDPARTDYEIPADMLETTANDATAETYDFPEPVADTATGCIDWLLGEGFGGFAVSTDVLVGDLQGGNVENWYVVNYHPADIYDGDPTTGVPGHVVGAYQYEPGSSLGWDQMLEHLPTDQPIAVYCWTGQTSALVAGYLNMIGYDAYTVVQGVNDMFYDQLEPGGYKWMDPGFDYPLEETTK